MYLSLIYLDHAVFLAMSYVCMYIYICVCVCVYNCALAHLFQPSQGRTKRTAPERVKQTRIWRSNALRHGSDCLVWVHWLHWLNQQWSKVTSGVVLREVVFCDDFLYPTLFHASFICCQWKVLAMVCSPFRTSTIPQINPIYFMKSKKLNCISCRKLMFKWLFFYRLIQELLLWFTRKFSLIWLIIVGFSFTWPHRGTERFLTLEQWVSDFKCILFFCIIVQALRNNECINGCECTRAVASGVKGGDDFRGPRLISTDWLRPA